MFIPPALQNTLKDLNDDGTDILLPINNKNLSGVTISNDADAANNGKHLGAYISPFTSDGHSKFSAETSDENAEEGFTGSLASANSNQSREAKLSLEIASKLDSKATGLGLDSLQTWKMDTASSFSTSSLLSANGAGLATGQSPLTNPLISNPSAAGTHPATQMVAAMIEKAAQSGSEKAQQELSIQLDPPELGRVQVHLSYEKGEAMKVHLTTEKQETLSLLQRDSHALKAALEQAGVQTDGSSLSFDMAGSDQSFNQLLGQGRDNQHSRTAATFSIEAAAGMVEDSYSQPIETRMNFVPDSVTGNVHYSLLV
jgi:flagellar hook-length control protein FliK